MDDVEIKRFQSFDGTEITYQDTGSGPVIILANGLGGAYESWRHFIAYFRDRYRILSWDYRGLYRSGRPPAENI